METAAEYLAERCVNTKEIIEGGYESTYNLVNLMEDYANHVTKEKDKEIEELHKIIVEVLWWDTCPDKMKDEIKELLK